MFSTKTHTHPQRKINLRNHGYRIRMEKNLLILAGDGIGPEVMDQVVRVIDWFNNNKKLNFTIEEDLVGGVAYDSHGQPLSDKTLEKAKSCDAVLY